VHTGAGKKLISRLLSPEKRGPMKTRLLAVTALFAAAACTPPTPRDLAIDAAGEVRSMVHDALAAAQSADGIEPTQLLGRGYDALSGSDAGVTVTGNLNPTTTDPTFDRMSSFLTDRVFTDANIESTSGGAVVFLLKGATLCTDGTSVADPTCVAQLDALQVRVRATAPGAGAYDLTLLIGARKVEPLTFKIRKGQSLTLEADLAQTKSALEALNAAFNSQPMGLPRVMEGLVQLKLTKNGAQDFTLSQSVLNAVHVEVDDVDGLTTTVRTAHADPLASTRFDGLARRMMASLAAGETDVVVPYRHMNSGSSVCFSDGGCTFTPNPSTALLAMHLGGASSSVDVQAGQTDFTLAHVGLGDVQSWVDFDGQRVFSTDLNPASGRHFDVKVSSDTDGLPLFSVVPEFDLSAHLAFGPMRAAGATIDSWLDGEDDALTFNGAAAPTLKPVSRPGLSGAMKVVAGTLSLSTSRAGVSPVVVQAGQCFATTSVAQGAHQLLGEFAVVPCQ
jgi:hypothetical protein